MLLRRIPGENVRQRLLYCVNVIVGGLKCHQKRITIFWHRINYSGFVGILLYPIAQWLQQQQKLRRIRLMAEIAKLITDLFTCIVFMAFFVDLQR